MPNNNSMPPGYNQVVSGVNDWNNRFAGSYDGAIDWSQNNPYSQAALPYIQGQLQGDMSTNPWMSNLYGNVSGVNMNEGFDYLRQFLGGSPSGVAPQGGGASRDTSMGTQRGNPSAVATGRSSSSRSGSRGGPVDRRKGSGNELADPGGNSRGGNIPDSTVGPGWFSQNIQSLFDPSRLDPANDPAMQPMIDAIQREAEEGYWRSVTDLTNAAEGAGRYGTGTYQAMRSATNEEYNEALQQTMAQQYQAARNLALQHQMEARGLVNTRDIASGQIAQADRQTEAQAAAAAAANASQRAGVAAQQAMHNREMQLQGIGQMLQSQQFGLGMQGNMAQLMQQGQLGALQAGQGYGQLGMMGYDAAANFGQLGMGAMNTLGGIYGDAAANRNAQARMAEEQRRYEEQAPIRDITNLIDIMSGLNNMGGYGEVAPYMPGSPGPEPGGFNWQDILGGGLAGAGSYYNFGGQ